MSIHSFQSTLSTKAPTTTNSTNTVRRHPASFEPQQQTKTCIHVSTNNLANREEDTYTTLSPGSCTIYFSLFPFESTIHPLAFEVTVNTPPYIFLGILNATWGEVPVHYPGQQPPLWSSMERGCLSKGS
ncbi:hypothetical protein CEXT_123791 [Caerostris extrusa]|uniref:Uncharacterized protein n=1 Tax=Caerostris extrusa TaxID=172846 RepID=A0AAV4VJG0_CAEEX|nr:hypothetical protein CEXT_123791 [Caerostris extrusa]